MASDPTNTGSVDEIHEKLFTIADEKILQILNLVSRADIEARRIATAPLRPRLVQMRPPRPLTALRILCEPFEDLLDHADRYERGAKRVSRETIATAWKFLLNSPFRAKIQELETALKADPEGLDLHKARLDFWTASAENLDAAVSRNPETLRALATLARRDLYRQLGDISQLLRNGDLILNLTENLPPKPIGDLIDEDVALIIEVLQESARRGSNVIEVVVRVLMARMSRPGELLEILSDAEVGMPPQEQAILTREMGAQASAHVVQQADKAAQIKNDDPLYVIAEIGEVAERIESLHVGELKGVQVVEEQLAMARNVLRDTVIREIVQGAEPEIASALIASAVEAVADRDERLQKAEDHLVALRRAERYGETLRITGVLEETLASVSGRIEAQAENAVAEFVDTPRNERNVEQAMENLYTSVRMLELAAGSNRADALRRKGMTTIDALMEGAAPPRSPTADLEE